MEEKHIEANLDNEYITKLTESTVFTIEIKPLNFVRIGGYCNYSPVNKSLNQIHLLQK